MGWKDHCAYNGAIFFLWPEFDFGWHVRSFSDKQTITDLRCPKLLFLEAGSGAGHFQL
jgi:hypothetical protein